MTTFLITLCILLLSLIAISGVTSASNSKKRPELEFCGDDVMAMYYKPKNLDTQTGRYDFASMFADFEYDTWNDFNRTYGYLPIQTNQDHCPDAYFELRIKQAVKNDVVFTIQSTIYVTSVHESDASAIWSNHVVVNELSDATHIIQVGDVEETTRDMSQGLKNVKQFQGVKVFYKSNNETVGNVVQTGISTENSEIWPPRRCTIDGVQYPSGDSECDNVEDYTYDLSGEDDCFSPCYNPLDDNAICSTLACSNQDPDPSKLCREYWSGTVPGCFCLDLQEQRLGSSDLGFFEYIEALYELHNEYPICTAYGEIFSMGMDLLRVLVVAVINIIISFLVAILAEYELHDSVGDKLASIVKKDFVARLLNTAFVILVVESAGIPGSQIDDTGYTTEKRSSENLGIFSSLYLFQGGLSGFTSEWYDKLAFALIFQMMVNIIEPHISFLLSFIMYTIQKSFVMLFTHSQHHLNEFYQGVSFPVYQRYAQILNTVFFTMIYSSALPIIIPICALNLGLTYLVDKFSILRFYNTNGLDGLNGSLAISAVELLPYALVLHLAFAIWIYSDSDVFFSNNWATIFPSIVIWPGIGPNNSTDFMGMTILQESYPEWLSDYENGWGSFFLEDHFRLIPRIIRWNVFPIFVLLLTVILFLFYDQIIAPIINAVSSNLYHCIAIQFSGLCRSAKIVPVNLSKRERRSLKQKNDLLDRAKRRWAALKREYTDRGQEIPKLIRSLKSLREKEYDDDLSKSVEEQKHADEETESNNEKMERAIASAGDQDNDGDIDVADLHYLDWRDLLVEFYQNYQKSKVDSVDDILLKYRGREVQLFEALEEKYTHAPFGKYSGMARKLYQTEMNELESIVFNSDLIFEPPYTGFCRQPVKLVDEIEFRKHLINKFDDNLGGWCRVENCDPRSTGLVYYQQVWDADGEINGLCHKSGNEKRAFSTLLFFTTHTLSSKLISSIQRVL